MQRVHVSPGLAPVIVSSAEPASLSPSATVPVEISLPAFWVVAVKRPKTPSADTPARTPTIRIVSVSFIGVVMIMPFVGLIETSRGSEIAGFPDERVHAGRCGLRGVRRARLQRRLDPEDGRVVGAPVRLA